MVINTNTSSVTAADNLQRSQSLLSKSLARLSSGSSIVSPADDAAGLAVASRLDAQIQRLGAAKNNVGNAISFTQAQDGFLSNIGKALNRMSELAILAQDATKTDPDRSLYNAEFTQLAAYVTTAGTKDFNGVPLFSSNSLDVTIDSDGNVFAMNGIDLTAGAYSDATTSGVTDVANASTALFNVKAAITQLAEDRATIGAAQARLNFSADQLTVSKENLTAASSRIQDVDVADESTQYAKANILVQAGTAMLTQANSMPQSALKLLQ
jgi:flagellin